MKLRLLSLFSGIGAFEKALKNIGVNFELIGFSEIDKYAEKGYCAIHDVDKNLNLGDITKINIQKLPRDIDIITHGSPCQDFSSAGLGLGGDKNSNTRSSLMWETVKIVKHCKPKYVIWENVKNVLSKKHKHNFDKYLKELENLGYTNYYKILNSKFFNVPQNRERLFVVSILGKHKDFNFPKGVENKKNVMDLLEENVDKKYYLSQDFFDKFVPNKNFEYLHMNTDRKPIEVGYIKKTENGKKHQSNTVYDANNLCGALFAQEYKSPRMFMIKNNNNIKIRRLTPLECFKLQAFDFYDFQKCSNANISNTQLYKLAGNSITVTVLEEIFRNLFYN